MASISRDKNGTKRVLFVNGDGDRKTIRLGSVPVKAAKSFCSHVEALNAARITGTPVNSELACWLADLPDVMHDRLVRVGLVEGREQAERITVGELLDRFQRSSSVKAATWAAYRQAAESLREFLGENTAIDSITPADADAWRKSLTDSDLASATVAKRVRVGKSIFKKAVRWGLLATNPLEGLRVGSQINAARSFFVSRESISAILAACPDDEWRAIVGLSRYAGLRCPSEIIELTWADINWERNRLTVRSPKTAAHDGHAVRIVPIAPELRPILLALFEAAQPGDEAVIPRLRRGVNLRTHFQRIITRAGVKPWPRLFHNMRASCATDWCERFPAHVVASWLGHSPLVAAQHYLQTRDAHFDLASGLTPAAQNAAQHGAAPECAGLHVASGLQPCGPMQGDAESCEATSGLGRIRTDV